MSQEYIVTIPQGKLKGKLVNSALGTKYYSFEGIPYAKPPIGELRFKAPQKPDKWTGLLDATKPGNKCAQIVPNKPHVFEGSEDCLYLNIHSPPNSSVNDLAGKQNGGLPVMVFVHGGSFYMGAGHYYKPDYFINNGVILVTINYRLGVLGYVCLNTEDVPGNAGCKDMILAFKWIRENIRYFGGDCNNLTAFGESGGASAIHAMTYECTKEDLFEKMILQSATANLDIFVVKEDYLARALRFAETLNYRHTNVDDLYKFLQNCSIEELMYASYEVQDKSDNFIPRGYFMPVVEIQRKDVWHFLTHMPEYYQTNKRYRRKPVIFGYNDLESAYFCKKDQFRQDLRSFIPLNFEISDTSARKIANDISTFYFKNKSIDGAVLKEYIELYSDILFTRDGNKYLEQVTDENVWFYLHCYMGSLSMQYVKELGLYGSCHSDELNYQFYKRSKSHIQLNENDRNVIEFFSKAWTNFAKFGDPRLKSTGLTTFDWPKIGKELNCLKIDNDLTIVRQPDKKRAQFWNKIYMKYRNEKSKL